ncbi:MULTISPECIES: GGDEF domain-containing protein [Acetobacterium]|jgi:diguanylate cyclase (GGDEF)-like protein|uniref:Putative diguanylate cyclase YeaP n=1 Tax=Acetobacterium wieringae TaxID=52694 RepID=A0A1F2PHN0_9FIRM|nr:MULTISPECIES: GGDEF domain-containing protein [Acetobacterium]OFV70555.1 putative diguanylate cyclase YeaP [Acetobacterium wieringae]
MNSNRKLLYKVVQLVCVVILGIVLFNIFQLVDIIQGTGRVINYTGIIRGGTQRLVKLETNGIPKDDLMLYLDGILNELQTGQGQYDLDKLDDIPYLEKLSELNDYWDELQTEIMIYRSDPGNKEKVVQMSETYFNMANDVVGTAEFYLEQKTKVLTSLELVMVILLGLLIVISLQQAITEIHLIRKNKELATAAYYDKPTGLPGRLSCEEKIWTPMDRKQGPYCMVMMDLNNLKWVNDTIGHSAGDTLIKAFADILNHLTNENVFVGRYGGDEFIMIIKNHREEQIQQLLKEIELATILYNKKSEQLKIQYAVGYEYGGDSLPQMLEKADEKMYLNKTAAKADTNDL